MIKIDCTSVHFQRVSFNNFLKCCSLTSVRLKSFLVLVAHSSVYSIGFFLSPFLVLSILMIIK